KAFKQALVSISFDDIWKTAYTLGAPELEKRGFKGGFYINHVFAEQPGELYASVADVKDLITRGHEIGSHAHRHVNLSQLAEPDLLEDLRKEMVFLKDLGVTGSGIAYPFGDFDGKVETEVQRFHAYARTSLEGLNDGNAIRYRLRVITATSDTPTETLLGWIDAARATNTWLIFLFHDLGEPLKQHPYRTPFSQYVQVLDAIKAKGLHVVTIDQGLKESGL
ncbi:MAG TPA: polysaccharide deacetylase family protein, partial [Candidatus Obscuribacterales bacterium]